MFSGNASTKNAQSNAQPSAQQVSAYLPEGPSELLIFDQFDGINTSTTRAGVDDKQAYWLDGFMPIGPRYLRTLYDLGNSIHTETTARISFFGFANIGADPYCIVVHTDGSVHAVNTSTQAGIVLANAGTLQSVSPQGCAISQWGSDFILLVSKQTDGYFLWDGTLLYRAGTLGPNVTVTAGGAGYTSAPDVAISPGSGTGFAMAWTTLSGDPMVWTTALSEPMAWTTSGAATAVATVANGGVLAVTLTSPGSGYLATDTPTVSFSGGGGSGATATVELMPFAVGGTAIEIYNGRVWIANGPTITYSAPGSYVDFSSASGGGNFTSSDSFLRVSYTQLKQTNGFLYLIGDSSINYISGVLTSGTPPITTFTNQNADPETGTAWPATVTTLNRNIVFANSFGAHVNYGASVTKISEQLDGIYNTVPNFGGLYPSAAKAIIFGKRCWILLLPIIDPVTGQQTNKLMLWNNNRWWASGQSRSLQFIQHQEINSVLTAYGTDGTGIYPLFTTPSTLFTKTAQSKLWTKSQLELLQTATRFWGAAQYNSLNAPTFTLALDNEIASQSAESNLSLLPSVMNWTTQSGVAMVWTTQSGAAMTWYAAGISVASPKALTQNGVMLGFTASTNCDDMAIIMLVADIKIPQYRG